MLTDCGAPWTGFEWASEMTRFAVVKGYPGHTERTRMLQAPKGHWFLARSTDVWVDVGKKPVFAYCLLQTRYCDRRLAILISFHLHEGDDTSAV